MKLVEYLEKAFPDIVNINYSSDLETKLDEIAKGKLDWFKFMSEFYSKLEQDIKSSGQFKQPRGKKELKFVEGKFCPECGKGLVLRSGRYGEFLGCSGWRPYNKGCNYIEKLEEK